MSHTAPRLKVRQLRARLVGGPEDEFFLGPMSFDVGAGELWGVIGPPGGGKTLLFKALTGLLAVEHDSLIEVDGIALPLESKGYAIDEDPTMQRFRRKIGMAFQNDALFDGKTVLDNVALPLRLRRVPEAEANARARAVLEAVHLGDAWRLYPSDLSGGMRKRVGIARAQVIRPALALFDDPCAGLDPLTGAAVMELIVAATTTRTMAALVISNDLDLLLPLCTRVMMIMQGGIAFAGTVAQLRACAEPAVYQFVRGLDEGPL